MWPRNLFLNTLRAVGYSLQFVILHVLGHPNREMWSECGNFARIWRIALTRTIADHCEEGRRKQKRTSRTRRTNNKACCVEFLSSIFYQTTSMKRRKRLLRTLCTTLFAWRISPKLLLTSTFAFLRWTRKKYRGLLIVTLDEHGNLIENLIKIKVNTISTLFCRLLSS